MMDNVISFYNCCTASQEESLSVMPSHVFENSISVRGTELSDYSYNELSALNLTKWFTVTALQFYRVVSRMIRACIRKVIPSTGISILRQSEILRI